MSALSNTLFRLVAPFLGGCCAAAAAALAVTSLPLAAALAIAAVLLMIPGLPVGRFEIGGPT